LDPRAARPPPAVLGRPQDEVRASEDEEAYLEATITESLRLRPVISAVGRYLTEPLELGGRVIPAGVHVNPSIYLLHRRPDLYPEPETFQPERFLDRTPGTYEWIPFGGGVRRCLGAASLSMRCGWLCARSWSARRSSRPRPAQSASPADRSFSPQPRRADPHRSSLTRAAALPEATLFAILIDLLGALVQVIARRIAIEGGTPGP
jgi:cytochrome P450